MPISVARGEPRGPRLAVGGGGTRVLAEKVDERLLDVGRHARSLAAHKHPRCFLQKVPRCVAIRCDRLLARLAGEGAHEFRDTLRL